MRKVILITSIIVWVILFTECNYGNKEFGKNNNSGKKSTASSGILSTFEPGDLLISEDFSGNLDRWMAEGDVTARIEDGVLFFSADSSQPEPEYQKGNLWLKYYVQSPYILEYDYRSLNNDHGLSMVFWNSFGLDGKNVFEWERSGLYDEYINGNLHAYHVSYHRFNSGLSNIRKAPGFHLVSSHPDPIPLTDTNWHKIKIISAGNYQQVFCDGKLVHDFTDLSKPCENKNEWMHKLPCTGTGDVPIYGAVSIRHTLKQQALYDNFKIYRLNLSIPGSSLKKAIIIDNNSEGFSKTGEWHESTRDKGYEGSNYLWCKGGDGSSRAVFTPELKKDGNYRVFIKWVTGKSDDRASDALYTVKSGDVIQSMKIDLKQIQQAGKWFMLGEYPCKKGKGVSVTLSNRANNSVVADAVMFLYVN